jgi:hypothetical protein
MGAAGARVGCYAGMNRMAAEMRMKMALRRMRSLPGVWWESHGWTGKVQGNAGVRRDHCRLITVPVAPTAHALVALSAFTS